MCVSRFKFVYPCRSTQLYKLMVLRHGLAKLTALLLIFCPTILSPWLVTFIRLDCFLRKLGRAYDGQFSFHGGTFCWRPLVLGISMDLADRKHCPMCLSGGPKRTIIFFLVMIVSSIIIWDERSDRPSMTYLSILLIR